ncbi:MAG: folate family ECF transporter S component [Clostridia bacterium]|nr:folate family ECF transporter S component [Clostridia bacterium]
MLEKKKITTKDLCIIAMLIAVTAVLGFVSGKLRIGTFSKFSFNFISVYFTAVLFGPIVAGLVGVAGDFVSAIGTGPYLWMIGLIEFVYGYIFGMLFYKKDGKPDGHIVFIIKSLAATLIIAAVDIFMKSYVLMNVGFAPNPLSAAVLMRLPMIGVMAAVRFVVLLVMEKSVPRILAATRN